MANPRRSDGVDSVLTVRTAHEPQPGPHQRSRTLLSAVSLFTGAGGLDLGCEAAGFATRVAVESDHVARETLLANAKGYFRGLTEAQVFDDIVTLNYAALLEAAGLESGEADLVHGGPPCTPFSKSGYWLEYKRSGEDAKASLLDNFVAALVAIRPKAFLMENVYGLAYQNHNRPVLQRFVGAVRAAGYSFDSKIILAADHGVPQIRQRLLCVGLREDLLDCPSEFWRLEWPAETHGGPHERRTEWAEGLVPHVTAREALATLPDKENPRECEEVVEGTYAQALREVPPGDNYLYLTAKRGHPSPRFEWRSRYWSFLLKLHPDRPSPTIQGQPGPWVGPFHWEDRRLRVGETKRLMTFPDDFVVCGSRREQQLQLGNAVPPLLAEKVAAELARELQRLGVAQPVSVAA